MKSLNLFHEVLWKPSTEKDLKPYIDNELGLIIMPNAMWAKTKIIAHFKAEKLSGNDLNKTFHKSWSTIKNSTRYELLLEQIKHYASTYGTNFKGETYLPMETLELPEEAKKLKYRVVRGLTKDELTERALDILRSGIALKEETIDDVFTLAVELGYKFTGKEGIRNKEALMRLADDYGIYPDSPAEFFRYIIYRTTGQSLVIKSKEVICAIKSSNYNPERRFIQFGLSRLAEIFNRFKPLFLAYKPKCGSTINKISKLSKSYHKPMAVNPLNMITSVELDMKRDRKALDRATPFALFKALQALNARMLGQTDFVYRVRNGKSFAMENKPKQTKVFFTMNFATLTAYLKERFNFTGQTFYFPKRIKYALPTSEKMFVGNIPTGTSIRGKKLAIGTYWENSWGANDIDISGLNVAGKIGWNSSYKNGQASLMYSGDITNAPNGAAEYMYVNSNKGEIPPTLIKNSIFSGRPTSYKIIVGKADNVKRNYIMNPNEVYFEVKADSVQNDMTLGILMPDPKKDTHQTFTLLNFASGNSRVSRKTKTSEIATKALVQQWQNTMKFEDVIKLLGGTVIKGKKALKEAQEATEGFEPDHDFSVETLEKDSFTKLFK